MPHPSFPIVPLPVPGKGVAGVKSFATQDGASPYFPERNYTIAGVTKDSTGVALGSCTVRLFNTATNAHEQTTVSDASGNYRFIVDKTQAWYLEAYKAGAPDVAATSVNTVVGV
jgi:hypothetical protein